MNEHEEPVEITDEDRPDVRAGSIEMPVDAALLEEVPEAAAAEPVDAPTGEQLAEMAEAIEIQEAVAERVATVRDEQALRIANMGQDGVHHFLLNVEGRELCGSCGTPFPCAKWTDEIGPANEADSSGRPVADEDKARAVAELLGMPIEQARQVVLMSTPLDKIGG